MLRNAFTMKLHPGAFAEYKRMHDELWPELFAEIERCGIASISIVAIDEQNLVLYSEYRDEDAWTRLRESEVHQRWGEALKSLFVMNAEGTPDVHDLPEIFHIRTSVTEGAVDPGTA